MGRHSECHSVTAVILWCTLHSFSYILSYCESGADRGHVTKYARVISPFGLEACIQQQARHDRHRHRLIFYFLIYPSCISTSSKIDTEVEFPPKPFLSFLKPCNRCATTRQAISCNTFHSSYTFSLYVKEVGSKTPLPILWTTTNPKQASHYSSYLSRSDTLSACP
jgi:hypothetical protein